MNLLDMCAVSVPSGRQGNGLPFGITLSAPAFRDGSLARLAGRFHAATGLTLGSGGERVPAGQPAQPNERERGGDGMVPLAVCGAHMSGLPLNGELTARGGVLARRCRTAPVYRLYALPGALPARPGLVRTPDGGAAIEVEVWALPAAGLGDLMAGIPAPLGIGSVDLEDGERVKGFLCEAHAAAAARDITGYGGWRAYLERAESDTAESADMSTTF
jgi:allophanate hydrolase